MNGQEFTDAIRDDHETALSRLGSSKWVYALTGGEMDADAVAAAWAAEAGAANETFAAWAADEDDDGAADVFADVAETAADHGGDADGADDAGDAHRPMYGALASLETTVERAGGLLAWAIVTEQTLAQFVGFYVGDADPSSANTFRDRRSDLKDEQERAESLLGDVCGDDADWTTAREAADRVVDAAYDDYVETLESMGIKPKNVC